MSPAKWPTESPDTQIDLQAWQNHFRATSYAPKPLPFCLFAPDFDPQLTLLFLFTFYGLTNQKSKYIFSYINIMKTTFLFKF